MLIIIFMLGITVCPEERNWLCWVEFAEAWLFRCCKSQCRWILKFFKGLPLHFFSSKPDVLICWASTPGAVQMSPPCPALTLHWSGPNSLMRGGMILNGAFSTPFQWWSPEDHQECTGNFKEWISPGVCPASAWITWLLTWVMGTLATSKPSVKSLAGFQHDLAPLSGTNPRCGSGVSTGPPCFEGWTWQDGHVQTMSGGWSPREWKRHCLIYRYCNKGFLCCLCWFVGCWIRIS